jgi:hypothetical protein
MAPKWNLGKSVVGNPRAQNLRRTEMTFLADCKAACLKNGVIVAVVLTLLTACGCGSGTKSNDAEQSSSDQKAAAIPGGTAGPQIDTNCVSAHIDNPPEAFHYSFRKQDGSNVHDEEADITPQTMDGTLTNNGARPFSFHGVHSDETSWGNAELNLSGAGGMLTASASLLKDSSAMVREGSGSVNGYDVTTYSIDTSRGTAKEKGGFALLLGAGGFAKGTASVTAQGCPANLILDEEVHDLNGPVHKLHFEMAMIRK